MTREPPASLGPEWTLGPDGMFCRSAARVILFDEQDRVLMVRGHDVDQPERSWWFTVGGGITAGEDPREAAVRELAEETGLRVRAEELVGPVVRRTAVFDFFAHDVRQEEEFFVARIHSPGELTDAGWTDIERDFMDELRWWALPDLAAVTDEVFPAEIVDVCTDYLRGWDGTARLLGTGP